MKNHLILLYLLASCFLIKGCTGCTSKGESLGKDTPSVIKGTITHYNVVIAPDLSNRLNTKLNNRPLKDEQIVKSVTKNILKILNHRRSQNQLDIFSVSFINQKLIKTFNVNTASLNIDFAKFPNQLERINYINGKAVAPKSTLAVDTVNFLNEFSRVGSVAEEKAFGADIYTYLKSGIDNTIVKPNPGEIEFAKKTYKQEYKNIMILLTDGYLEAGIFGKAGCPTNNQCYYLDNKRIDEFRNAFKNPVQQILRIFLIRITTELFQWITLI